VTTGFSGTEAALTLNAREQRILSRISDELAKTAPALVSLLHFFNRLTSDEDMPARRPLRRLRRRLSTTTLMWLFVSVWTFVTMGMLSFALIMTHTGQPSAAGGQSGCPSASSILLPCGQGNAAPAPPKG
jgi:hypothetical protein